MQSFADKDRIKSHPSIDVSDTSIECSIGSIDVLGAEKSPAGIKPQDASNQDSTGVLGTAKSLSDLKPPKEVHAGPRALEVWIDHAENLPELRWYEWEHVFVQFKPNKSSPHQQPYGGKLSTSVRHREETWDDRMLICVDEKKPASIRFQIMRWQGIRDHKVIGEVKITKEQMSLLMTQDIGFCFSMKLPLYHDGKQVLGKTDPSYLYIKLVVVTDSTKALLKYSPVADINLQLDVEHVLETLSVKKAQLPLWRMVFLGLLSGVWMAISGCFAFAVAGDPRPTLLAHLCEHRSRL